MLHLTPTQQGLLFLRNKLALRAAGMERSRPRPHGGWKHWGSQGRTRVGISPHADCAQEIGRELEQTLELLSFPFTLQHALGPSSPSSGTTFGTLRQRGAQHLGSGLRCPGIFLKNSQNPGPKTPLTANYDQPGRCNRGVGGWEGEQFLK